MRRRAVASVGARRVYILCCGTHDGAPCLIGSIPLLPGLWPEVALVGIGRWPVEPWHELAPGVHMVDLSRCDQ